MRRNIRDIRWKLLPHLYLCLRAFVSQFRRGIERTLLSGAAKVSDASGWGGISRFRGILALHFHLPSCTRIIRLAILFVFNFAAGVFSRGGSPPLAVA